MTLTVCIGSSCHLKGSRQVVEGLQKLIAENRLEDKVLLSGTFCMQNCQAGVCVSVDDTVHSVSPETVEDFFLEEQEDPEDPAAYTLGVTRMILNNMFDSVSMKNIGGKLVVDMEADL